MILLINDLLDLDRMDAGRLEIRPEALSVEIVIERAINAVAHSAEVKGITINGVDSSARIYADPAKDLDYKRAKITRAMEDFDSAVSSTLTGNLAYDPSRIDVGRMLTSAFAHASWGHLIGNLIFFFILIRLLTRPRRGKPRLRGR